MRALITLGMVVDLDPEDIPEFAASVERSAMAQLHASFDDVGPLDEAMERELQDRFQMYGVSYSIQQTVEPPVV